MVRSMTGYGRAQGSFDGVDIVVELKSVNHRYLEFSPKVPRDCVFLEEKLKSLLQSMISRGKVDMFLTVKNTTTEGTVIEINRSFADPYINALKTLVSEYGVIDDISVSTLSRNSDMFTITKADVKEDELWGNVKTIAIEAIVAFIKMREQEGERLKSDVISRVNEIKRHLKFIEENSPKTVTAYREKLEQRMKELLGDVNIDEQRLITETGIMADKLAVCEETVRLNSHLEQLCALMELDEPLGRKLDFIVQEMNRETNTIGSKAQDLEIARAVVEIKSEIEKIREQIQNIE